MSKSYFLRLFRRYMGTTPYNYLVNFRITQAKELLVLTDHSVSEIAQEVGFWRCQQLFHPLCKSHRAKPSAIPQKGVEAAGGHKVNKGS